MSNVCVVQDMHTFLFLLTIGRDFEKNKSDLQVLQLPVVNKINFRYVLQACLVFDVTDGQKGEEGRMSRGVNTYSDTVRSLVSFSLLLCRKILYWARAEWRRRETKH